MKGGGHARHYDRKTSVLQGQSQSKSQLATYAPFEGQEASQIKTVASLEPWDRFVTSYRNVVATQHYEYP